MKGRLSVAHCIQEVPILVFPRFITSRVTPELFRRQNRSNLDLPISHGAVAPRPCIATGKGVDKKIDKVGFTPCGSILSFLGFVTASLCNILLEQ